MKRKTTKEFFRKLMKQNGWGVAEFERLIHGRCPCHGMANCTAEEAR